MTDTRPRDRIMLVSRQAVVARGVELLLTAHGLQVVGVADNTIAAAEAVPATEPHLVLVDLALGGEACDCVRLLAREAPWLPTLAFGPRGPWAVQEMLDAGLRGFTLTEHAPDEFVSVVRVVAEGGHHLDADFAIAERGDPDREQRRVLSDRERQILGLLACGFTGAEVAGRLFLSPATVRTHVQNAMRKLGARTRAQAIAISTGDATPPPAMLARAASR